MGHMLHVYTWIVKALAHPPCDDSSFFGGGNLPTTMDKKSFGAHQWYGVSQGTYGVIGGLSASSRVKLAGTRRALRAAHRPHRGFLPKATHG